MNYLANEIAGQFNVNPAIVSYRVRNSGVDEEVRLQEFIQWVPRSLAPQHFL